MGRIKTKKIKRQTQKIYADIKENITADFTGNKKAVEVGYTINSKKLRNVIAGYCTRLKRQDNQEM